MENKELEQIEINEEIMAEQEENLIKKISLSIEKIKIILWGVVALLVVIAVLVVSLYIKSDKVGKAFDSEQYNRVQLTITQQVTFLDSEEETDGEDQQSDSTNIYGDGNYYGQEDYYYDENGNLITEDESNQSQEQSNTESYDICILKKDGDVSYEKSMGEFYKYSRDGKNFVLYYDDFYGINKDNPDWVEVYAENYSSMEIFDFKIFDNYEKSDFKKVDDYYVPKGDMTAFFHEFLKIVQVEKYQNCDIKFYFDNGRASKIVASYLYDENMDIVQTYKFTYRDEEIKIPAATIKYDKDGNKIDLKSNGETKK